MVNMYGTVSLVCEIPGWICPRALKRLHKTMRAEFFTPATGYTPPWRSCRRRWMGG